MVLPQNSDKGKNLENVVSFEIFKKFVNKILIFCEKNSPTFWKKYFLKKFLIFFLHLRDYPKNKIKRQASNLG